MALGVTLGWLWNTHGGRETTPPAEPVATEDLLTVALPQAHTFIGCPARAYAWIVDDRLMTGEGYALQQRLYVPADGVMTFHAFPEGPGWHLAQPLLVLSRADDNFTAPWETLASGLIVLNENPARITTPDTLVLTINADGTLTVLQDNRRPADSAGLEEVEAGVISLRGLAQST